MARNGDAVARHFVAGEPVKRGLLQRVRGGGPWGGGNGGLTAGEGTIRFGPDASGTRLLSYERWTVAVRVGPARGMPIVVLNADGAPSATTAAHQRDARDAAQAAAKRGEARVCLLPFSALRAARVEPEAVEVVATTSDRVIVQRRRRADGSEYDAEVHFLGETLFRHGGRLYVSGLDRADDPARRNFYLARLPAGAKAKTVDEALAALRPRGLPREGVLRQGEWFLVPSSVRPAKAEVVRSRPDAKSAQEWTEAKSPRSQSKLVPAYRGVPIVTAEPVALAEALVDAQEAAHRFRGRGLRHVASRVYLNGAVHVSGVLRDAEHGTLRLGDQWYRVVRNRADGSWGAEGKVD